MTVYEKIMGLLNSEKISFKSYEHEPILSYEDANREKNKFNWKWIESKNVFMTNKKGKYFLFVTVEWEKVDFKEMKKIIWEKLSITSSEDVINIAKCVPWCVSPFWLEKDIFTIIDKKIFNFNNYLFSPWVTTQTIQLDPNALLNIFKKLENKIFI